jgi:phosphoglycolate phosphatase-like HAD superfamily hydrolase
MTITIPSNLSGVDGNHADISIRIIDDVMPVAIAFFDIDKTLAHLDIVYKEAIHVLFPNEDTEELIATFLAGFRLGNSFREFDRMHCIYAEGKTEWKDPEIYIIERLNSMGRFIDTPGNEIHDRASVYLKVYGAEAAKVANRLYQTNPELFSSARIGPLYTLLEMYKNNGVMMFGFTANAKVFVDQISKYLGLSEYFIDIATDETMEGGGKEIAIKKLLEIVEGKNLVVPKESLIFIGDSIRGDIGSGLLFCKNTPGYSGYGILVVSDMNALIETRTLIDTDQNINNLVSHMPIYALVVSEIPQNHNGFFSLLSVHSDKFFFKL